MINLVFWTQLLLLHLLRFEIVDIKLCSEKLIKIFKIKLNIMRSSDIIKQAKFDNYLYKSKITVELETLHLHADIKFKSWIYFFVQKCSKEARTSILISVSQVKRQKMYFQVATETHKENFIQSTVFKILFDVESKLTSNEF